MPQDHDDRLSPMAVVTPVTSKRESFQSGTGTGDSIFSSMHSTDNQGGDVSSSARPRVPRLHDALLRQPASFRRPRSALASHLRPSTDMSTNLTTDSFSNFLSSNNTSLCRTPRGDDSSRSTYYFAELASLLTPRPGQALMLLLREDNSEGTLEELVCRGGLSGGSGSKSDLAVVWEIIQVRWRSLPMFIFY